MNALFALLAFVALFRAANDPEKTILPSMVLSNWHDSMISWAVNRNFYAQTVLRRGPGVTNYVVGPNYELSSIQQDSFVIIDGANKYTDPLQFKVLPKFDTDGVLTSTLYQYNGADVDGLELTIKHHFPPYHPFYLVQYTFHNTGAERDIYFMTYTMLQKTENFKAATHIKQENNHMHSVTTMRGDGDAHADEETLAIGVVEADAAFTDLSVSVHGRSEDNEPLKQFDQSADGKLDNNMDCTDKDEQEIGFSYKVHLDADATVSVTFYRAYRPTKAQATQAATFAESKQANFFFTAGKKEYDAWLKKGKQPVSLSKGQLDLYKHSLLMLKNGQNPSKGPILASFHPRYEMKTWTRDGFFAAYVLSEAGYEEEAALFWKWMGQCEMHPATDRVSKPYFYTCYSAFTGKKVDFVDPQLDSMGQFLMGAYHLFLNPATRLYLKDMEERINDVCDFLLECRGMYGLLPADYSIWEESSDQMTGDAKNPGYFAFTQAFGYAGIMAGSKLQEYYFHNAEKAEAMRRAGLELHKALMDHLVEKQDQLRTETSIPEFRFDSNDRPIANPDVVSTPVHIYRQLLQRFENGKEIEPEPEAVPDTATMAWYFLGLLGPSSSSSPYIQTPYLETDLATSHYNWVIDNNQKGTDGMGMARYPNDHYFFDGKFSPARTDDENEKVNEASDVSPPWGVTTMFTMWAELSMGMRAKALKRLQYMTRTAADGALPVGEAIDHNDEPLWSSAPDIYEHGGVYVLSALLNERKARLLNPMAWNHDGVL